jgi:hypothetical protein
MRQGLFTLPFTEDYAFQGNQGSQQMFDLQVTAYRAAIRPLDQLDDTRSPLAVRSAPLHRLPSSATTPARPMMQYVMSYDPGNTVNSQRRRFFGSIAHGVKWIHLYEFQSWPTSGGDPGPEVWRNRPGMYAAVRSETNLYGMFDDIVASGANAPQGAKAAMLFSATADIYQEGYGTSGAAKRALFLAIKHAGIALDVVIEEDLALKSSLAVTAQYSVIYITDRRITTQAGAALATWVAAGGIVFSAVGGAMTNETDQPNLPVMHMLGVESCEVHVSDDDIDYIVRARPGRLSALSVFLCK